MKIKAKMCKNGSGCGPANEDRVKRIEKKQKMFLN